MTVKVTIPEDSRQHLENVLRDTLLFRGGDPVRLVHKAMAYIASFAIASGSNAKIPIADKEKIRAALKTIVTNSSRRFRKSKTGRRIKRRSSKNINEWTGTLASVLVATIHSWGTRTRSARRQTKVILRLIGGAAHRRAVTPSVFYRAVAGFAGSRTGSVGYLRSGLIPALKLFKAKARAPLGFKHPPGTATPRPPRPPHPRQPRRLRPRHR